MKSEDIDRPPAGTECCVCRTSGHYCPASRYVGNTDTGICEPCVLGKDCPTHAAIRKATNNFEDLAEPEHVPTPARTVPREQWKPTEVVKVTTTQMQDLLQPDLSGRAAVRQFLNEGKGPYMEERKVHYPIQAGGNHKTAERQKCKEILLAGGSTRDAIRGSGLSGMTVQKVRKELGMLGRNKIAADANGKERFTELAKPPMGTAMGWSDQPRTYAEAMLAERHDPEHEGVVKYTHHERNEDGSVTSTPIAVPTSLNGHSTYQHPYEAVIRDIDKSIADFQERIAKLQRARDCLKELV